MAKCPKCDKTFLMLNAQAIKAQVQFGNKLNCLAYTCPSCQVVLNVEIDPMGLKADIVDDLFKRLKKGK